MIRRHHAISLYQATQESEVLSRLCALANESTARLESIQSLLPGTLRHSVRPGPIEGPVWCLLLDTNAAAAKIRQLLPALLAHLRSKGWEVNAIRIKVQKANLHPPAHQLPP
ncbi:MAG: DciA family protein [Rhodoferax sp.]|nr:DciA family protein [Rhodoferax sp.]